MIEFYLRLAWIHASRWILPVFRKFKCMLLRSTDWLQPQPVWPSCTLKASSVWPRTCLDLLYLDSGPHPAQSRRSVCPGMSPPTAILLWNNRELFGKGGKINTPSVDYPPAILGPFGSAVCSEHQRPVRDVGLKGADAQFNQTFGCLCVRGHEPPSQKNLHILGAFKKKPNAGQTPPLEWGDLWNCFFFEDVGICIQIGSQPKKKKREKKCCYWAILKEKSPIGLHITEKI